MMRFLDVNSPFWDQMLQNVSTLYLLSVDELQRIVRKSSYEEIFNSMEKHVQTGCPFSAVLSRRSLYLVLKCHTRHSDHVRDANLLRLFLACGISEFYGSPSYPIATRVLVVLLANNANMNRHNYLNMAIAHEKWSQVALLQAAGTFIPLTSISPYNDSLSALVYQRILQCRRPSRIERFKRLLKREQQLTERTRLQLIRKRIVEICIALQRLELPALVTLAVFDAVFAIISHLFPLHIKYRLITTVKHF